MSFLKRLFGGAAEKPAEPAIEYKGFDIQLAPMDEGGQFRLCGVIAKEIDGENKSHKLVRADMYPSLEDAKEATLRKAKQVIDEQGERLF